MPRREPYSNWVSIGMSRLACRGAFYNKNNTMSVVITNRNSRKTHGPHFLEHRLRMRVAVVERVLAALLVVDDEVHRDLRAVRPVWVGRVTPVSSEVTGSEVGQVDGRGGHL